MALDNLLRTAALGTLLAAAPMAALAAPPASQPTSDQQAPVQKVDADIAAARARNTALQAQVAELEQRNAAERKRLDERDATIAALEQKLKAAGGPASAASAGN